jgi:hypothetical protein
MTKKRLSILGLFAFCAMISLAWGSIQARTARGVILDYRVMDLGARCLLQHGDLYDQSAMMRVYAAEEGSRASVPAHQGGRLLATLQVYPPSAELFFAPFALLPWPVAYCAWIALTVGLMILAAFLMWDAAQVYAPDPPFFLACIVLANSGILFSGGNPAGVAVSLCVIGAWCFFQKRFQWAGVLCMAASLAIKPHDGGLVWFYALILGGIFRKRALQSLAVAAALGLGGILWVSQISPNWAQELRANLSDLSSPGSYNDPSSGVPSLMIHLQIAIAAFRNEPHFYNLVAYLICAPLLLLCFFVSLRVRPSAKGIWLGVATVAVLSLLPLYHRPYDAKILLLTLPACAALWAEGGIMAWLAIAFTGAGILITSDIPVAALSMAPTQSHSEATIANQIKLLLTTRPAPLVLLAMGIFYLWAYLTLYRRERLGLPVTHLAASTHQVT